MTGWQSHAACIGLWDFTERDHDYRAAHCTPCPVRAQCAASDPWPWYGAKPEGGRA